MSPPLSDYSRISMQSGICTDRNFLYIVRTQILKNAIFIYKCHYFMCDLFKIYKVK